MNQLITSGFCSSHKTSRIRKASRTADILHHENTGECVSFFPIVQLIARGGSLELFYKKQNDITLNICRQTYDLSAEKKGT